MSHQRFGFAGRRRFKAEGMTSAFKCVIQSANLWESSVQLSDDLWVNPVIEFMDSQFLRTRRSSTLVFGGCT